jgi:hypothetical protein
VGRAHGPERSGESIKLSLIVLYVDAPILRATDLIDLPGLNETAGDSEIAQTILVTGKHGYRADAAFFCSIIDQFCLLPERSRFATWRNTAGPDHRESFWFIADSWQFLANNGAQVLEQRNQVVEFRRGFDAMGWPQEVKLPLLGTW